ncbi:NAD-dependent epimerase/dehydratase family protein [Nocardia sp. NBC_01503]|uniref:NAD-dependent epimerase/dehydratase family protein n=1 Tax=Nocardia sp. NBC_01503 TaxID=2975997 RepID=UPI002E7B1CBA|nr:NAD-dependent epimerase/dehydratase family protein [Nocardia sp. NBC_01503]WTL34101.1 NAD-dependent epimerase/dehydratase family protein [Nocardia sp. NBC_01503]
MSDLVLVTGASGYLAGHVIEELQGQGYRVRGTVRSLARAAELTHLSGVEFVQADLDSDAGWAEAVAECRFVLHTASPFPVAEPESDDELVRPAVDGALRVLRAAAAAGVERVVLTSSVAAVMIGNQGRLNTEADWSDINACNAYEKSKTLAERAAWDFAAAHPELELAVINPGMILGPIQRAAFGTSVDAVRILLAREMPGIPDFGFATVDVRDVAIAHRLAMELPQAVGNRYICAGEQVSLPEMTRVLAASYRVPTLVLPDWLVRLSARFNPAARTAARYLGRTERVSAARATADLGWTMRPVRQSLLDTAASLIHYGIVLDPGAPRGTAARSAPRPAIA